jgi:UDP-glucose 4-epimerase
MKILIVGSNGFIGSALYSYFSRDADNIVFGCDIQIVNGLNQYFQIDPCQPDFLLIFENYDFDFCINCSGSANVMESFKNTECDYHLNVQNVFYLLDSIKISKSKCKFINFSSAAVYGNPLMLPIIESSALMPMSPYAFHKLQAEFLCKEFNSVFSIPTCSLRVFSAYGDGLKKQLFWDVWQKINSNKDSIYLFGTGYESRDFIHVKDIARAVELVMRFGNFSNTVYNLGNGVEVGISDAVSRFCNIAGWSGNIVFDRNERIGDPLNWCADISLIRGLGYSQSISFNKGLEEYVIWARNLE